MNVSVVAHNIMAMNGSRQLNINSRSKSKSAERLASGYRINRASDDAAGLAISEKIRKQVRGLDRGQQNTQDGVSFCQTADGAMNEVHDMLQRMQELCVQAANDTNSYAERASVQREINQLKAEICRISDTTKFNDRPVFHRPVRAMQDLPMDVTTDATTGNDGPGDKDVKGGSSFGEPLTISRQLNLTGAAISKPVQEGMDGYAGKIGNTYASALFDLGGLGRDFSANDLIGQSICTMDTETGQKYNLVFGDSGDTGGRGYLYAGAGDTHTLTVNVQGQTSGANAVKNIFTALGNTPAFTNSHVQYARDNFGKFWIYDNRSANLDDSPLRWGKESDFEVQDPSQEPTQDQPTTENDPADQEGRIWIHSGAEKYSGMWLEQPELSVETLGIDKINVESSEGAKKGIDIVADAIDLVSAERSRIGAQQNRLEHAMNINANVVENLTHAESVIRDTDMAKEMVEFMKANVLEQVGQSVLAQANQTPEKILSLLQE